MNTIRDARTTLALALALASMPLLAQPQAATPSALEMTVEQKELFSTEGMQAAHPDFRWRWAALRELDAGGDVALAQDFLTRAARYADKPAQAMLAELYWTGRGVAPNRALAYAWMDLAAERGYVFFVAHREKYWQALSEAERDQALVLGRALYAEYGDDVAKPRLEKVLKRSGRTATGSRLRHSSFTHVYRAPSHNPQGLAGVGTRQGDVVIGTELPGYYDPRLWAPAHYWTWQDQLLTHLPESMKKGQVDVGELQEAPQASPRRARNDRS